MGVCVCVHVAYAHSIQTDSNCWLSITFCDHNLFMGYLSLENGTPESVALISRHTQEYAMHKTLTAFIRINYERHFSEVQEHIWCAVNGVFSVHASRKTFNRLGKISHFHFHIQCSFELWLRMLLVLLLSVSSSSL